MSLSYPNQVPIVLIGTKTGTTRTGVALPTTYGTNIRKSFPTEGFSELVFSVAYTTGAAETNNSVDIIVEGSDDDVNFYRLTNESATSGTSTLTQREFVFVGAAAATTYEFSYRLDVSYKYMRVNAKESGVAANAGTVFVEALLSGR